MQRGAERLTPGVRFDDLRAALARNSLVRRWAELRDERRAAGRVRLDPGRPAALAMLVMALITVLCAGGWVLSARPHRVVGAPAGGTERAAAAVSPGGSLLSPRASTSVAGTGASPTASPVVVDVVGKVRRPGVYRLMPGARVEDAVTAAGGVLAGVDPASVNLARKVTDGEQLAIGLGPGEPPGAPAGPVGNGSGRSAGGSGAAGAAAPTAPGAPVDLNSATAEQLDALPGVGPVLAQRIVDWRTQHGRFDSVDQLQSVSGIGDSKFSQLRPLVTAG